jgi:transposase
MTQQDRDRLVVLRKAEKKLIGQGQAARELGVTPRQIRRLLRRLKKDGDKAVMHKLRGRPSNRKAGVKTRAKIVRVCRKKCIAILARHWPANIWPTNTTSGLVGKRCGK